MQPLHTQVQQQGCAEHHLACLPPQVACGVGFTAFLVKADEPKVAAMGVYEPPEEPQVTEAAAAKGQAAAGAKRKAAAPAAGKAKKAK